MQTALPRKRLIPLLGDEPEEVVVNRAGSRAEPIKWAARSLSCDNPKGLFELDPTHLHGVVSAQLFIDDKEHAGCRPLEFKMAPNGYMPIYDSPKGLLELDPTHVDVAASAQAV